MGAGTKKTIYNSCTLLLRLNSGFFFNRFSYQDTPRARIFARDHTKVVDMQSMLRLMRSNDFKHDPESKCDCIPPYSSENAISSR